MSKILYLMLCVPAAGEYDYAIAFQERIRIPDDKMDYYKDLAEMYVGDDVSPDFYGWVFPKYDHVAVGETPPIYLASSHCVLDSRTHPLYMVQGGEVVSRKTERRASSQEHSPDPVACMQALAQSSTRAASSSTSRRPGIALRCSPSLDPLSRQEGCHIVMT